MVEVCSRLAGRSRTQVRLAGGLLVVEGIAPARRPLAVGYSLGQVEEGTGWTGDNIVPVRMLLLELLEHPVEGRLARIGAGLEAGRTRRMLLARAFPLGLLRF